MPEPTPGDSGTEPEDGQRWEDVEPVSEHQDSPDPDDGAARLGEVALVDREGRIGPLGTVFFDTLLDENAASHIALGHGYVAGVADPEDTERANKIVIHTDFMIGSNEVAVTGFLHNGDEVPLLRDGIWQV